MLAWAGAAGCLSPQEIELDVKPAEVNVPPVFDPAKDATPRGAITCVSGLDEAPVEFRVGNVRDANGSRLEARWFIDYEGGFTAVQKTQLLERDPGEAVYPATTFDSSGIDPYHKTLGRPFTLEVVVSDGFVPGDAEPKNRAVGTGNYAAGHRWVVDYKAAAPCE